jgi:hypothetical protein
MIQKAMAAPVHMTVPEAGAEALAAAEAEAEAEEEDEDEDAAPAPVVLSYAGFLELLTHKGNDAYDPVCRRRGAHSMHESLASYYIASSHNTCLAGSDVAGLASVDRFVAVLEQGCRCLELRCWDGDPDSDLPLMPLVSHSGPLSTTMPLDGELGCASETCCCCCCCCCCMLCLYLCIDKLSKLISDHKTYSI